MLVVVWYCYENGNDFVVLSGIVGVVFELVVVGSRWWCWGRRVGSIFGDCKVGWCVWFVKFG